MDCIDLYLNKKFKKFLKKFEIFKSLNLIIRKNWLDMTT